MKVAIIGGGPAGLYAAILLKKQRPQAEITVYERNREMIDIGAYRAGSNAEIDQAVNVMPGLTRFLRQSSEEAAPRAKVLQQLQTLLQGGTA